MHKHRMASKGMGSALVLVAIGVILLIGYVDPVRAALDPGPTTIKPQPLAARGLDLYQGYCITCHGETGSGLAEARLRFPETHQRCERCHRLEFPPIPESGGEAFSIGDPPALRDLRETGKFTSQNALYEFIRATMPRWAPGSLSDEEYLALSSYLWDVLGG